MRAVTAKYCGGSSCLADFLAGEDYYPVFRLLQQLLDEAGLTGQQAGLAIVRGSVFTMLALAADGLLEDPPPGSDETRHQLSQELLIQAHLSYSGIFPPGSPFWEIYLKGWQSHGEVALWHRANHVESCEPYRDEDWIRTGYRWAPLKAGFAAVLLSSDRACVVPDVARLLDELNALFQIRRDILSIPKDLARHVYTMPIDRIAATLPNQRGTMEHPDRILGALLLARPLQPLISDCLARLDLCGELCRQIGMAHFDPVIKRLRTSFEETGDVFDLRKRQGADPKPETTRLPEGQSFKLDPDRGPGGSLAMAEAYLLADPELRESWEVHRWGFLGRKVLTGRNFPCGFILELLLESGLKLSCRLDDQFGYWQSTGLRYFEEECPLPPDADSLGLMLRLLRFSSRPSEHAELIRPALARMRANVTSTGDIPTYFVLQPAGEPPKECFCNIAGNDCSSVKAGLLLGLLQLEDSMCLELIPDLLGHLLRRVAAVGSEGNVYYPAGYWLWQMFRLLDPAAPLAASADPALTKVVREVLERKLDQMIASSRLTPQQAALLMLCCSVSGRPDPVRHEWVQVITTGQRHDGAWEAEPIYRVPTINNRIGWHSSRLMTTALCHHALALWQRSESCQ